MVDMFKEKMCNYCKSANCGKNIKESQDKDLTIYKCNDYVKDPTKIVPYEQPLVVTAERKHVTYYER